MFDYWRFLNSFSHAKSEKIPSITEFFNFFKNSSSSKFDDCDRNEYPEVQNISNLDSSCLNRPINETEINKVNMKSNNGKAVSNFDFISNEYLKSTRNIMVSIFCSLFNVILHTGILPETWLIGSIKPIFKNKGSSLDQGNYRPITILSCLGKIFTAVLNERISEYLSVNTLLHENQAGFRAKYSTTDHIFTLHFLIEKLRSKNKKLFCSFIDFSSAFDSLCTQTSSLVYL